MKESSLYGEVRFGSSAASLGRRTAPLLAAMFRRPAKNSAGNNAMIHGT